MHALFLELSDRNWALVCWFALHASHFTSKCAQLGLLGHHAWKCAIDGPRTKNYVPLSHIHDKGLGWCIYGLNCIAMQGSVLCCCQTGSAGTFLPIDCTECRPANNWWPMDSFSADEHLLRPVAILSSRWYCTVFRKATLRFWQSSEEYSRGNRGRLRMAVHFRARPSMHCIGLSFRGGLLFLLA